MMRVFRLPLGIDPEDFVAMRAIMSPDNWPSWLGPHCPLIRKPITRAVLLWLAVDRRDGMSPPTALGVHMVWLWSMGIMERTMPADCADQEWERLRLALQQAKAA